MPTRSRAVVKAFTWRLVASLDTFVLGFLVTGRPVAAASIAGGEVLTKMLLYYLHERGWAAIDWGHRASRRVGKSPALAAPYGDRLRHTL